MDKYSDIINREHHTSKKHPRMTIEARAAQFAPFAALTGYGEAVKETARLTNERIELDDEEIMKLNEKIQIIKEKIKELPLLKFTFFVPDIRKQGGEYIEITDKVKKIDEYKQVIILESKEIIPINEIINIDGEIFNKIF